MENYDQTLQLPEAQRTQNMDYVINWKLMVMVMMVAIVLSRFGHHLLHHFFPAVDLSKLEYLIPALQVVKPHTNTEYGQTQ